MTSVSNKCGRHVSDYHTNSEKTVVTTHRPAVLLDQMTIWKQITYTANNNC